MAVKSKGITSGGIQSVYRLNIPYISPQNVYDGNTWRNIARSQSVFMDCITTLSMYIQGLPYDIRAKDSQMQDELHDNIIRYKEILKNSQHGMGMSVLLDLLVQDFYMIPFGCGLEATRYQRDRELSSIQVLDGATLYPSYNDSYPVVQLVPEVQTDLVFFKPDELYRIWQFPRPEISRTGWQMPQSERIYLALESLNRGDRYYANLLLDTPEAGLLDLGDMSKDSAEKWLDSFKNLFTGIDAFKMPVLYEHTIQAKYLPFNRPPTEMMFDNITIRYAQLVCAAFGLTIGDIGMKSSVGSLSDSIRDERHSKSTGKAFLKKKIEELFNKLLPEDLIFWFVDTDDELLVSKGRARSANAVAIRNLIESGTITPKEARQQLKADGLITIPIPEEPNMEEFEIVGDLSGLNQQIEIEQERLEMDKQTAKESPDGAIRRKGGQGGFSLDKRRNVRGAKLEAVQGKTPVPASRGGQGEIKAVYDTDKMIDLLTQTFGEITDELSDVRVRRLIKTILSDYLSIVKSIEEKSMWLENYNLELFDLKSDFDDNEIIKKSINGYQEIIYKILDKENWWVSDIDETELGDILLQFYANGLRETAHEIQEYLYENGIVDNLSIEGDFKIENDEILQSYYAIAGTLIHRINEGTKFYISRLVLSSINNVLLDEPEIEDAQLIDKSTNLFKDNFINLLIERIKIISEYELSQAYNEGVYKQFKTTGVKSKYVVHIGKDIPCENCQKNINVGEVPLDFEYETNFNEKSLIVPSHPGCHCKLRFGDNVDNIKPIYFRGE